MAQLMKTENDVTIAGITDGIADKKVERLLL